MHTYTSEQDSNDYIHRSERDNTPPDEEEIIVESDGVEREKNSESSEREKDIESKDIVKSENALALQTTGLALRDIGDRVRDNVEVRNIRVRTPSKPKHVKKVKKKHYNRFIIIDGEIGKQLIHINGKKTNVQSNINLPPFLKSVKELK